MSSVIRNLRRVVLCFGAVVLGVSTAGMARAEVDQTLDSIAVFGRTAVQGVVQTPAVKQVAFADDPDLAGLQPLAGTNDLKACQLTGTRGLFCLDADATGTAAGIKVLRWINPDKDPAPEILTTCAALGLVNCNSLTVDLAGNFWVSGQKVTATTPYPYSLRKVVATVGVDHACTAAIADPTPAAWITTADLKYCYREYASFTTRIYDLSMVDGTAAGYFQGYGPGVLMLRDPSPGAAIYVQDTLPVQPVRVLRDNWNSALSGSESLQGLTFVQQLLPSSYQNYLVVTTNGGRVLSYALGANKIYDTTLKLNLIGAGTCTPTGPYKLRASQRTDRTFFTSGNCVTAYNPVFPARINNAGLTFPTTPAPGFPLATAYTGTETLTGVSVSPGTEVDFVRDGCTTAVGCLLITNGAEEAARFRLIQLGNPDATGWVMYQVTGIPDCRYLSPRPAICAGAVINPDGTPDTAGTGDPRQQYLNIKPLLPPEVRAAFDLPPMLLQPDYSAPPQAVTGRADYTFDAIFGIPEPGMIYRETFEGIFDVGDLIGSKLGCGGAQLQANSRTPPGVDVVLNVSELATTVGGPSMRYPPNQPPSVGTRDYASMLLNKDCTNPTRLSGTRGSAFVYGLGLSPKMKDAQGRWLWPDSAYALLMRSLARDFNDHLYTYACTNLDETSATAPAPVDATSCYNLKKDWPVVYDKLTKCIDATDQPKNSAGSQNCGSFDSQFPSFYNQVLAATIAPGATDPQNRVGELKARITVLSYVYTRQFTPSIKDRGFTNPN